ncbi:MAG: hypothetical protein KGQ66_13090 [Acidobacteriota bacterium]|nr:hypothetical protein [Acidobacteriota bacterium]
MADSDTLTIRVEMLSDVPVKAAEDAAAIKALTEATKTGTAQAGTAVGQLGAHLDATHQRTEQVAAGSKRLKKAYDELYESGKKLREGISSVGESITERLQYPMQQLSWTMEAAGAGMVTFGLLTASSLQQGALALSNLTGSATVGAAALARLRQMQGPVGLSQLEGGYSSLFQSGMSNDSTLSTLKGLSGLAAVSGNPNASFQAMSSAIASMQSTGLLTTSDVQAFSGANVNIWGMLAKETGQSPQELRTRFLRAGTPMATPSSFMSDLMSSPGATGGKGAYDQTWAGQVDSMKKSVGDMLAVFETPLGNALAGASAKIDGWAKGTESRFKQLGGGIGQEWSSGNMAGLSATLAGIVGDPKLAGDINIMVTALHGLDNIVTHEVIPMGEDLMAVATPALKGFADVLDFMGQHRTATEALIGTFGGLIVLARVARWTQDATGAIKAFSAVMEAQGALSALAAWSRGLSGLAQAQEAVAATAAAETGAETAAGAGGALGGLGGKLGALGAIGGGGYLAYHGATAKHFGMSDYLDTVGGATAAGAMAGSFIPGIGTAVGAIGGATVGAGISVVRSGIVGSAVRGLEGLFGGGGGHTSIKTINVTVPGAGDPTKVANAVPKAINAQINAQKQMTARRGG